MRECKREPLGFGRVGRCDLWPLWRKALKSSSFTLQVSLPPYLLSWWQEREGGAQRVGGSDEGSSLEGAI